MPTSTSAGSTSPARSLGDSDFVGVGLDLEPDTLLAAYAQGLFPMPFASSVGKRSRSRRIGWWSPDPRGILQVDALRVSRSLRRSCARFEIRVDTATAQVIDACADPRRTGAWIDRRIRTAYLRLHELGWVHSVEAWSVDDGTLAGGLYGVAIGGLFAGESMFHRRTDASKVALVGLVELLRDEHAADRLLDVQWRTEHLASLGVVEIARSAYLRRLELALALPPPAAFARGDSPRSVGIPAE